MKQAVATRMVQASGAFSGKLLNTLQQVQRSSHCAGNDSP